MAVEILGHSRPVRGVKMSSRIERESYRTVLVWICMQNMIIDLILNEIISAIFFSD